MKKILLYSGITIIIILIIVFLYILFFGTPKDASEVFTNFGIGGGVADTPVSIPDSVIDETPSALLTKGGPLFRLSNRSVAGMTFVGTTTVRYTEKGTGHVYEIDLLERTEEQVSFTTFERVMSAEFSSEGTVVLYEIEDGNQNETLVGFLTKDDAGGGSIDGSLLPIGAHSAGFVGNEGSIQYILPTPAGSSIYTYNPTTVEETFVAQVPHQALRSAWPSHVYTKPTAELPGYVYNIDLGTPTYVTEGGFGLTTDTYDKGIIVTTFTDGFVESIKIEGDTVRNFAFPTFPEKCADTHQATTTIVCAGSQEFPDGMTYPDDWYKGIISFEDTFWIIRENSGARPLYNPAEESKFFDVSRLTANTDGSFLLFTDKNDDSLWLLDLSSLY
ncbi:hypothetical protein KTR10_00875 [Candidatus Kaiserbacteria bacterium]|nr:hypothetical protein [Candidatus Kaiserbacteria bacterium]